MSASRGADDREAFIKACADGNTRRVRRLLDRGADVEAAVDGQPANYPLLVAVRNDRHDTVRLLLERGADVNRCPTYEASEWRLNPPPNPYHLGATRFSSGSTPSARRRRARDRTDGSSRRDITRPSSRLSCRPKPRARRDPSGITTKTRP